VVHEEVGNVLQGPSDMVRRLVAEIREDTTCDLMNADVRSTESGHDTDEPWLNAADEAWLEGELPNISPEHEEVANELERPSDVVRRIMEEITEYTNWDVMNSDVSLPESASDTDEEWLGCELPNFSPPTEHDVMEDVHQDFLDTRDLSLLSPTELAARAWLMSDSRDQSHDDSSSALDVDDTDDDDDEDEPSYAVFRHEFDELAFPDSPHDM
jgi:hypothetical protein